MIQVLIIKDDTSIRDNRNCKWVTWGQMHYHYVEQFYI